MATGAIIQRCHGDYPPWRKVFIVKKIVFEIPNFGA